MPARTSWQSVRQLPTRVPRQLRLPAESSLRPQALHRSVSRHLRQRSPMLHHHSRAHLHMPGRHNGRCPASVLSHRRQTTTANGHHQSMLSVALRPEHRLPHVLCRCGDLRMRTRFLWIRHWDWFRLPPGVHHQFGLLTRSRLCATQMRRSMPGRLRLRGPLSHALPQSGVLVSIAHGRRSVPCLRTARRSRRSVQSVTVSSQRHVSRDEQRCGHLYVSRVHRQR